MTVNRKKIWLFAPLLMVGACGGNTDRANDQGRAPGNETAGDNVAAMATPSTSSPMSAATPPPVDSSPMPSPANTAPLSCSAELGKEAAAKRVAICRNVSPATHPPCNAANSCAMIEDEIARSCALLGAETPMQGCGPDPKGKEAAANVVRNYYSALNARDYATAWSQWGDDGRPGQTFAAFKDGFAHTSMTRVTIGTLEPGEGAAGSVFQPVPVTVEATLDDGTHQRFSGNYVVRRVNDVDGSSASQRRWHIASAQLRQMPAR